MSCKVGPDAVHLADLARDLAGLESAVEETPGWDGFRSIYIQLYHNHLPKLDEVGVVSFDTDSKMVSLLADTTPVERM